MWNEESAFYFVSFFFSEFWEFTRFRYIFKIQPNSMNDRKFHSTTTFGLISSYTYIIHMNLVNKLVFQMGHRILKKKVLLNKVDQRNNNFQKKIRNSYLFWQFSEVLQACICSVNRTRRAVSAIYSVSNFLYIISSFVIHTYMLIDM